MMINLDGKCFRALDNSDNGDVSSETIFYYHQEGEMVWADYTGGLIIKGFLIGLLKDSQLTFSYHHLSQKGEILTGLGKSRVEESEQGKTRLIEKWQWTCKDYSEGTSLLEEI